jgi:hypothetical protein
LTAAAIVVILPDRDDDASANVILFSDIDAAREELVFENELLNSSIVRADDALVVVKESLTDFTLESKDPETLVNEVLSSTICVAADELKVVSVEDSWVIVAAKDALSKEPDPAIYEERFSTLAAREELAFINVVYVVSIDEANDALLKFALELIVSIRVAIDSLVVVNVASIVFMELARELLFIDSDEPKLVIFAAKEEELSEKAPYTEVIYAAVDAEFCIKVSLNAP